MVSFIKFHCSSKICVDERGVKIEDYEADPTSDLYETMDCSKLTVYLSWLHGGLAATLVGHHRCLDTLGPPLI